MYYVDTMYIIIKVINDVIINWILSFQVFNVDKLNITTNPLTIANGKNTNPIAKLS